MGVEIPITDVVIVRKGDKLPKQDHFVNVSAVKMHLKVLDKIDPKEIGEILFEAEKLMTSDDYHIFGAIRKMAFKYNDNSYGLSYHWKEVLAHRALEKAAPNHQIVAINLNSKKACRRLIPRAIEITAEWAITGTPRKCFFSKDERKLA